MIVATWNTGGFKNESKQYHFLEAINLHPPPDIICLTDTHQNNDTPNAQFFIPHIHRKYHIESSPTIDNNVGGAAILTAKKSYPPPDRIQHHQHEQGRIISVTITTASQTPLQITAIYAPAQDQPRAQFLSMLPSFLPHNGQVILTGDFNCVANVELDTLSHNKWTDTITHSSPQREDHYKKHILPIIQQSQLIDAHRHLHPNTPAYTCFHPHGHGVSSSRIDHTYIPTSLALNLNKSTIQPIRELDHHILYTQFSSLDNSIPEDTPRAIPSSWFNNKNLILNIVNSLTDKPPDTLQHALQQIHKTASRFGRNRKNERNAYIHNLAQQAEAQTSVSDLTSTREHLAELYQAIDGTNTIKKAASLLTSDVAKRKASKRLTAVIKPRNAVPIPALKRDAQSDRITLKTEIGQIAHEFYNELFSQTLPTSQDNTVAFREHLLSSVRDTLTPEHLTRLNSPLTLTEFEGALQKLPVGKAAGPDGIPTEAWKCPEIQSILIPLLLQEIHDSLDNSILQPYQAASMIAPIFKKGDPELLSNYRPISLLNTGYKIYSKAVSLRLTPVLEDILSIQQRGFLPKRSTIDVLADFFTTLDTVQEQTHPCMSLLLDYHKAFDSVNHNYVKDIFQSMGVPPNSIFQKCLHLFMDNSTARVLVNSSSKKN